MLDPRTIRVAIPCYDGRVMSETAGALINCGGLFAAVSFPTECSHVSLARDLIAADFLASPYEWLVCIDADIGFSRTDMELLLQACDTKQQYREDMPESGASVNYPPRPTRVICAQSASLRELDLKTSAAADVLVAAEYSFKNDSLEPVKLGMGFVRIHRSVFERLQALKHDGGSTVEVSRELIQALKALRAMPRMPQEGQSSQDVQEVAIAWRFSQDRMIEKLLQSVEDRTGTPRLWQASRHGRLYHDYFPSGPIVSAYVPTAEWKGEDHGFFTLCMLAGIIPRIETRTRLMHIGRKAYPYLGPDLGGGQ